MYSGLKAAGYQHVAKVEGEPERAMEILPHIHLIFSNLKTWLLGTHHGSVQKQHMQAYLNEFTFRFNRRTSRRRGLLFYRLLQQAVITPPVTYQRTIRPDRERA